MLKKILPMASLQASTLYNLCLFVCILLLVPELADPWILLDSSHPGKVFPVASQVITAMVPRRS